VTSICGRREELARSAELEDAELFVSGSHLALALQHADFYLRLVVGSSTKNTSDFLVGMEYAGG